MHDSMPYDPIQGQGHGASDVPKIALFKVSLICHLQWELARGVDRQSCTGLILIQDI